MKRRANIYTIRLLLLPFAICIDPYLLFNIGFQLSYLAVLGIVYFQPVFYRQWYIQNRWRLFVEAARRISGGGS